MSIPAAIILGLLVLIAVLQATGRAFRIEFRHIHDINREEVKLVPVELSEDESRELRREEEEAERAKSAMAQINTILSDME